MKISIWIPEDENKDKINKFIEREITEANNIKSKETRNGVTTALTLLKLNFGVYGSGFCYYSEDTKLVAEKYNGKIKKYHCGREFVKPEKPSDYT